MLEFPEVVSLARQLQKYVVGRTVENVFPPVKPHKFCWFNGAPEEYEAKIQGADIISAKGFGLYVEIGFDNGYYLCINDGVHVYLCEGECKEENYQLKIRFTDGASLIFTVAMYGGIILHKGDYENEYYGKSQAALSPLDKAFPEYYQKMFQESKKTLSAKAFLATDQRFPGIGNGVIQDILLYSHIHPKRKIDSLTQEEKNILLHMIIERLKKMEEQGGRDTERDLFNKAGGYRTCMSKKTYTEGSCPICGGKIQKESYLGGTIYYCPDCQPLKK
ncbi:MAG: endonuclease VIII [Lachnospiraceae bacterium]|nr:endonuclease VIII [Lachnospiraceae bacterium]